MELNRFKQLLESTMGDVKPLVSERQKDNSLTKMGMDITGLNAISQMRNIPGTNIPGGKDKWGRQSVDCWYGFNPTSKMFENGPCKGIAGKDFTTKCKPKKQNCTTSGGGETPNSN